MSLGRVDRSPEAARPAGTCRLCLRSATVYPGVDKDGVWTWVCGSCSEGVEAMR